MQPLVKVYRGSEVESVHHGSVAVVDARGRLLAWAGDPAARTFLRSAAKPFQAIALLEEGGAEEYELTGEEIALICASHGGEAKHVSTASAILRKGDFDETDLLCGAHAPYDAKSAADLRMAGEAPSPLHNNCSGKHAGMLLATQLLDLGSDDYISPDHPLQLRIREIVASFLDLPYTSIPLATDGCSLPTFHTTLYRAAWAWARLAQLAENGEGVASRFGEPARQIVDAMTTHPDFVAGSWSVTTPLMDAFDGGLLAKEGAEGFYAMAVLRALRGRIVERIASDDHAIGIAIKIADGSSDRARIPVIMRTLALLGITPPENPALAPWIDFRTRNVAERYVGHVSADFELETP